MLGLSITVEFRNYFQLICSIHAPYIVQEYSCRYKLRSIIIQFHLIQLTLSISGLFSALFVIFVSYNDASEVKPFTLILLLLCILNSLNLFLPV